MEWTVGEKEKRNRKQYVIADEVDGRRDGTLRIRGSDRVGKSNMQDDGTHVERVKV